jgi:nanoRNase/pAp phosphatase (c-di-AMP/oligoRNAs hydrolase)
LGLTRDFSISNYQWSLTLPKLLTQHTVEEILAMPDSQERVKRYQEMQQVAIDFYKANSWLEGNVIVTDVREKQIPPANRFLIYAVPGLEPGNISVRIASGKMGEFNTISVAYSIFNRSSKVDCGTLCKSYGGGGHKSAATCQPSIEDSERVLAEIVAACQD